MVLVFLDNESSFAASTSPSVRATLEALEDMQEQMEATRDHCEAVVDSPELLGEIIRQVEESSLSVTEADLSGLCLGTDKERIKGREQLSNLSGRLVSKPYSLLKERVACRERTLALDLRVLDKVIDSIRDEVRDMEDFEAQRDGHAETTRLLREALLKNRRQRAMQRELDERASRLKELRDLRLREIAEQLAREAEIARLLKIEMERALPPPRPTYVSKVRHDLGKGMQAYLLNFVIIIKNSDIPSTSHFSAGGCRPAAEHSGH